MSEIHDNARSAWLWLVEKGGLEPAGRDVPLITMLKNRLDPETVSLDEALANTTLTGFINAFFGVITPFVGMMRDLLDYFESAGATEGPVNWVLALGDEGEELEIDLDAFRKWIERGRHSESVSRTVPILNYSELWELRKNFYPTRTPDPQRSFAEDFRQPEPAVKGPELVQWLDGYEKGEYLDLPTAVRIALPDPGPVGDVAALLTEVYSAVRTIARNRDELRRKGAAPQNRGDFWSAAGLAQFESDFWVRGRVLDLAAYEQATPEQQSLVKDSLTRQFQNIPRRRVRYDIDLSDLEQILSLPAWQKRYELYSAWILTLLLTALKGHLVQLRHQNGRISFAFRETLMASILSAVPPIDIYSERRVPLANPMGHGRSSGAQPDYSLWKDSKTCPLAIECKHYKRSSTRNFADALNDYAAALGDAQILLVNYGPVSNAVLAAIKDDRRSRCVAIGPVNPEEPDARKKFCEVVRRVVGEPVARIDFGNALNEIGSTKAEILILDVSGSMRSSIDSSSGLASMTDLIRQTGVKRIATVDERLLAEGPSTGSSLERVLSERGSGGTNLGPAVQELRRANCPMLVLTDSDGAKTLGGMQAREIASFPLGGSPVTLLLVA